MKYLGLLFIFLLAFTMIVSYVVIGEGAIENIIDYENYASYEKLDYYLLDNTSGDNFGKESGIYELNGNNIGVSIESESEHENENENEDEKKREISQLNRNENSQIVILLYDAENDNVFEIELEEYLCGVVFSEMPSSFEIEALKAQAIAARSYCIYKTLYSNNEEKAAHNGADVCTDFAHCKEYISYEDACEKWGSEYMSPLWDKVKGAVLDTSGEIIVYESEPAIAVFHAMSASSTESAENLWGGKVPYLVSVPSPETENSQKIKDFLTTNKFDANIFKSKLIFNGFRCDFSENADMWLGEIKLNSSGRVDTVQICGKIISGRRLREIFSLRSTDFTLEYDSGTEEFVFTAEGYGHGVGMSQYGANLLAEEGKDCRAILAWYYTGTETANIQDLSK